MDSVGGLTKREKAFVAVCDKLSATCTVKFEVPTVVGVPLITPPEESVRPAGSAPVVIDQM